MATIVVFAFYFSLAAVTVFILMIVHVRRSDDVKLDPRSLLGRLSKQPKASAELVKRTLTADEVVMEQPLKIDTRFVSAYLHEAEPRTLPMVTRVWLEFDRPQAEVGARTLRNYTKRSRPPRELPPPVEDVIN